VNQQGFQLVCAAPIALPALLTSALVIAAAPALPPSDARSKPRVDSCTAAAPATGDEASRGACVHYLLTLPTTGSVKIGSEKDSADIRAILGMGPVVVPTLARHISEKQRGSGVAALVLGEIGPPAAEIAGPALRTLAREGTPGERGAALLALTKIDAASEANFELLKDCLAKDCSSGLSDALIMGLGRFDPAAFPVRETLRRLINTYPDAQIHSAIRGFRALGFGTAPDLLFLTRVATGTEPIASNPARESQVIKKLLRGWAEEEVRKIAASFATADAEIVRRTVLDLATVAASKASDEAASAVLVLGMIGAPAARQLVPLLQNPDHYVTAGLALDYIGAAAEPELIAATAALVPGMIELLPGALARQKSKARYLIELNAPLLEPSVTGVARTAAVESADFDAILRRTDYRDEAAKQNLYGYFKGLMSFAPEKWIRVAVKAASASERDANVRRVASEMLLAHVDDATELARAVLLISLDEDSIVARNATRVLQLAGPSALPVLVRVIGDPAYAQLGPRRSVERKAVMVLGEIGDLKALPALERRYAGEDRGTRKEEAAAIDRIRHRNRLPSLNR
jgi:HEAT repeat protein